MPVIVDHIGVPLIVQRLQYGITNIQKTRIGLHHFPGVDDQLHGQILADPSIDLDQRRADQLADAMNLHLIVAVQKKPACADLTKIVGIIAVVRKPANAARPID